jgi:hypothetical protein
MTAAKIAITLPAEELERVRQAVSRGRADSVSAYITKAIVQQGREESLAALVNDLVKQFGRPTREEQAWARRVLGGRSKRKR